MDTNIPVSLTSFVGRERELAELTQLLEDVRLLTLVGAGGVGKTRLAMRLARNLAPSVADGVWVTELAALQDPGLVAYAVAATLNVRERPDESIRATLCEVLKTREVLLVLDNCEHLIETCAELVQELLLACPKLRVVATSRQTLGVAGEATWRVPSLSMLDPGLAAGDEIGASEAVRLFLDRSRSVLPGFVLTDQNAATVAQICRRLDGIPLAIELAAARVNALGLEQILARLDDRFRLLSDASRRVPARHRTLAATVDWSHDLLTDDERLLFRRLAVFAGGWTLEAAEAVCSGAGVRAEEVFDRLSRLVDRSLVVVEGQATVARYGLLETLRQYALERLEAAGEAPALRDHHLDWYLALAQRADAAFFGPAQSTWLAVLEREHDNARAALRWCLDSGAVEKGLALATAYASFWEIRGHRYRTEGRRWLEEGLAAGSPVAANSTWARAAYWAGTFAAQQFDFPRAVVLLHASLDRWAVLLDRHGRAEALYGLGQVALQQGDFSGANENLSQSRRLAGELGDQVLMARVLRVLGSVARAQGDPDQALSLDNEALALCRAVGDDHQAGHVLDQIGEARCDRRELDLAAEAHARGMALLAAAGCEEGVNSSRYRQACLARARGDGAQAIAFAAESLRGYRVLGNRRDVPACLDLVAEIVVADEPERATRLFAAAEAIRESMAVSLPPVDRAAHAAGIAAARAALGPDRFARAWSDGRTSLSDDAIGLALTSQQRPESPPLTSRELEVAILVGRGHSNKEIAAALVVSVRTVEAHVTSALNKLALRSRAQLAVWTAEHGLLG
ncbi:MAG TPA: tetratricopeptide repeat protein [Chloroflexota bacterium]|nr:tetratricopeptide repeat protein [Chloroflexota bacterium]